MVWFLTAVLIVSWAGLAALLWAKHWELATGRVMFAGVRPVIAAATHRGFAAIQRHLPALAAKWVERLRAWLRVGARAALAHAVLSVEQWLERMLKSVRSATSTRALAGREASAFLREVAEHKKKLAAQVRIQDAPQQ